MGDILDKCMDRAERQADKVADGAANKIGDEAKKKVEGEIHDLIHKTSHTVNDKTSKELLESHWCVQKEGGGGVTFTKVQPCDEDAHSPKDCDPMVLKCSDDQNLEINMQCSKCKKHMMVRN